MRPKPVQTREIIQKRIVTCDSGQPKASKWWWIGADRKTFLLNTFLLKIWMRTERDSITSMIPKKGRKKTLLVSIVVTPRVIPKAIEPVSPIKNFAG